MMKIKPVIKLCIAKILIITVALAQVSTANAGNATDTRTVVCKDSNGNIVADSFCAGAKPSTTRVGQACASNPSVTAGEAYVVDTPITFSSMAFSGGSTHSQEGITASNAGNGNNNFEGLTCRFSVTIQYNGQSASISEDNVTGAGPSFACGYSRSVNIGGRTFNVNFGATHVGDGIYTWRLHIT